MQIERTDADPTKIEVDAIVIGLFTDGELDSAASQVDKATGGAISQLIEDGEITGKPSDLVQLLAVPSIAAKSVLIVGLGKREEFDRCAAAQAAGAAIKKIAAKTSNDGSGRTVAFFLAADWDSPEQTAAVSGAIVGSAGQDIYRSEKKIHPLDRIAFCGISTDTLEEGRILGESVNFTRRLVNEPPQVIYPESFVQAAEVMATEVGLEIEIWDEQRLETEKCGALLAVGRGSNRPSRLAILRHQGTSSDAPVLALVGKGVTFDSGGLSIKPSDGMLTMKMDMAGAATVVGAMRAIAKLKLPVNVMGVVGLAENMISGDSYKLGDVLTARNGRTIEVHNTDAEGRLVLADTLSVAVDCGAKKIVDLATLTGACVVALGLDVAGVMSNDQPWCDQVLAAAERCGEQVWQLPMFTLFDEQIESNVADIKNVGQGRWGGAITAAKFLEQFVGEVPWTHIDIAGPAFREKPKPWSDAGASGQYVQTLVELARSWKSS